MTEEEPDTPKRALRWYAICALIFFGLTLMTHPVIASFFWLNLAVALYCLYRAIRAAITVISGR